MQQEAPLWLFCYFRIAAASERRSLSRETSRGLGTTTRYRFMECWSCQTVVPWMYFYYCLSLMKQNVPIHLVTQGAFNLGRQQGTTEV